MMRMLIITAKAQPGWGRSPSALEFWDESEEFEVTPVEL